MVLYHCCNPFLSGLSDSEKGESEAVGKVLTGRIEVDNHGGVLVFDRFDLRKRDVVLRPQLYFEH